MPTAPTAIPAVPTPVPQTSDSANFDTRADATLTALPGVVDGMNDLGDNVYANAVEVAETAADLAATAAVAADPAGLVGKSNTTLTVSAGSKAVTLTSARASLAVATKRVALVSISDPSIKMLGNIASSPTPTSTVFTVTVTSSGVFGSGTYGAWEVIDAAFYASGATAAEVWAGTTEAAAVTPKALKDAMAAVALTYASTVTPDLSAGTNRTLTASASFTMDAPINCFPGQIFVCEITNSAGSIVLAVNAAWKRQGGLGLIGANNTDRSTFVGLVREIDGSGVMTRGLYNIIRTPS